MVEPDAVFRSVASPVSLFLIDPGESSVRIGSVRRKVMTRCRYLLPRFRRYYNPTAVLFTLEDLSDLEECAALFALYGVTYEINISRPNYPETVSVYLNAVPVFELWRSTKGCHLRDLTIEGDTGGTASPRLVILWALMVSLLALPVSLLEEKLMDMTPATKSLPQWLRV
jgi:hypothetical protein